MLIEGKHLFPLELVQEEIKKSYGMYCGLCDLRGYYVDSQGQIYSKRNTKVVGLYTMKGSTTKSGKYYTLDGTQHRADTIIRIARSHPQWDKETGLSPAEILSLIRARSRNGVTPSVPRFVETRDVREYAGSLDAGIRDRGWVIATAKDETLIFGTKPRIHTTEQSVKNELERLAKEFPGTRFISLRISHSVVAGGLHWA
jgi:hypothetical protein